MKPWEAHKIFLIAKIKELLETKHLYQSSNLSYQEWNTFWSKMSEKPEKPQPLHELVAVSGPKYSREDLAEDEFDSYSNYEWFFTPEIYESRPSVSIREKVLNIDLPHLKIQCSHCKASPSPHNSGFKGFSGFISDYSIPSQNQKYSPNQLYLIPYQCQSCRGEPVTFFIKRHNYKIQLVGRSIFEEACIPRSIPKQEKKWLSHSAISFNCGHFLAAFFYMRIFIEQHWRRVLSVEGKVSIDDLAEKYNATLPPNLISSIPSLKYVYDNLSEKIHGAVDDEIGFLDLQKKIFGHFELLRVFNEIKA